MIQSDERQPFTAIIDTISSETLKRLLDVSMRLSSTHRLDDLLSLVMQVATELTDTQKASILLVNRSTGKLHFTASTDSEVPQAFEVPLDNSIAGWVVQNGRTLVLGDVQSDKRFYANVDRDLDFTTRSMLAVPLITNKGIIGALEVLNKKGDASYTEQDIGLMEALASQSAVAILNAYLFHQSDLLAEIMHEIKTPLMAITSAGELLSRPELPADKHGELVGMIKRESLRVSQMTRDFLDFARLESGRERLKKEPVDVVEIVQDVMHIAESQAKERGITITKNIAPDFAAGAEDAQIIGDPNRLKQVILNLVSNATKYNRRNGRITISVELNGTECRVRVQDTGKGIAPEDVEHLFERFYRIPGSERVSEGSGMGLAIANKIVEAHDGRIEVESVLGEGTTFAVCLPVTAVSS